MSTKVAIVGSGNIGTDLMIKVLRTARHLEMGALVGIDPASDGLARAARMGVPATAGGLEGLLGMDGFSEVGIVFDATSAASHARHNTILQRYGKKVIDLTPAAIGPYVVPVVNLDQLTAAPNLNMVSCGGQATIPIVAAVNRVAPVHYAEIVASASRANRPDRARVPTSTSSRRRPPARIERVGGATPRKGDHRPQPGRAAAHHAQHRVLPGRRWPTEAAIAASIEEMVEDGPDSTCRDTA